jgi:hypothetical protein
MESLAKGPWALGRCWLKPVWRSKQVYGLMLGQLAWWVPLGGASTGVVGCSVGRRGRPSSSVEGFSEFFCFAACFYDEGLCPIR